MDRTVPQCCTVLTHAHGQTHYTSRVRWSEMMWMEVISSNYIFPLHNFAAVPGALACQPVERGQLHYWWSAKMEPVWPRLGNFQPSSEVLETVNRYWSCLIGLGKRTQKSACFPPPLHFYLIAFELIPVNNGRKRRMSGVAKSHFLWLCFLLRDDFFVCCCAPTDRS